MNIKYTISFCLLFYVFNINAQNKKYVIPNKNLSDTTTSTIDDSLQRNNINNSQKDSKLEMQQKENIANTTINMNGFVAEKKVVNSKAKVAIPKRNLNTEEEKIEQETENKVSNSTEISIPKSYSNTTPDSPAFPHNRKCTKPKNNPD